MVHRIFSLALLSAVAAVTPANVADAQSSPVARFVGSDGNWFNARNWSTGRVPDATTDVVIGRGAQVVIDPSRGSFDVAIRDLTIEDGASLTTLAGTLMHTRDERVRTGGQLVHRSSGSVGNSLVYEPGEVLAGFKINPTPKQKRIILLQTIVTTEVGLGGLAPASLTQTASGWILHAGQGHYATATAEEVVLAGELVVTLHYGFRPQNGDSFQIITGTSRLTGQFTGLAEGALAGCTEDNVGLYVSYERNAVQLSAKDTSPSACLLLPGRFVIREHGKPHS